MVESMFNACGYWSLLVVANAYERQQHSLLQISEIDDCLSPSEASRGLRHQPRDLVRQGYVGDVQELVERTVDEC